MLMILYPATSTHNHSVSDCSGDLSTSESVTIPTAHGQTWQGRGSCSGLVFPTRVYPNPKPVFFGYFLPPETRGSLTKKNGYFERSEIAVAIKY